jgi:hypothetical protein
MALGLLAAGVVACHGFIALALMIRGPDLIRIRRQLLYKYSQRVIIKRPVAGLSCVHRINTL